MAGSLDLEVPKGYSGKKSRIDSVEHVVRMRHFSRLHIFSTRENLDRDVYRANKFLKRRIECLGRRVNTLKRIIDHERRKKKERRHQAIAGTRPSKHEQVKNNEPKMGGVIDVSLNTDSGSPNVASKENSRKSATISRMEFGRDDEHVRRSLERKRKRNARDE